MEMRSAKEIIKEIEATRQQIGSVSMIIDGAQVHYVIESIVESLQVIVELFMITKNTEPNDWDNEFGSQADSLKTARELGFTAISTIKTFISALPDNLKDFDKKLTPDKFDVIESFFKEN